MVALALLLPFVGVFIYLISQGHSMGERRAQEAQQQKAELDAYVRSVAASSPTSGQSGVAQLEKAHDLMRSSALTPEEYEALKKKVLV